MKQAKPANFIKKSVLSIQIIDRAHQKIIKATLLILAENPAALKKQHQETSRKQRRPFHIKSRGLQGHIQKRRKTTRESYYQNRPPQGNLLVARLSQSGVKPTRYA
jgi:hypothetical protein